MPIRVFKDFAFHRWAKNEGLSDDRLRKAALEIEDGLVDARLGGFLVKKRVGAPGRGKRGGIGASLPTARVIAWSFCTALPKNEIDNITKKEKEALHKLGDAYMNFPDAQLTDMAREGVIIEVKVS